MGLGETRSERGWAEAEGGDLDMEETGLRMLSGEGRDQNPWAR